MRVGRLDLGVGSVVLDHSVYCLPWPDPLAAHTCTCDFADIYIFQESVASLCRFHLVVMVNSK